VQGEGEKEKMRDITRNADTLRQGRDTHQDRVTLRKKGGGVRDANIVLELEEEPLP